MSSREQPEAGRGPAGGSSVTCSRTHLGFRVMSAVAAIALLATAVGPASVAAAARPGLGPQAAPPAAVAGTDPRLAVIASAGSGHVSSLNVMTPDGAHLFESTEEQLNPADPAGSKLYDIHAGEATLIAVSGGSGFVAGATDDGSVVVFQTPAALSPQDTDLTDDLYVRSGSVTTFIDPGVTDAVTAFVALSADGSSVVLRSNSSLLPGDGEIVAPHSDLYRWTVATGMLELLTPDTESDAGFRAISPDGSRVLFATLDDLTGELGQVSLTGFYERVGGAYVLRGTNFATASPDLSRVYFNDPRSYVPADTDAVWDGYLWDALANTYTLLTPDTTTTSAVDLVSDDGSRLLVETSDALLPADQDTTQDYYVIGTGFDPILLSTSGVGQGWSIRATPDLSVLSIATAAALDPTDANGHVDLYRMTLAGAGAPQRLTDQGPNGQLAQYAIGPSGDRIVFATADPLVAEDVDSATIDLYAWEPSGFVLLTPGTALDTPTQVTGMVKTSDDLERVAFRAQESLDPHDTNNAFDWYIVDFDITAPVVTIAGPSAWSTPAVDLTLDTVAHDGARFACALDETAATDCGPALHLAGLADGPHSISVVAWDIAGNASAPVVHAWQVDGSAPSAAVPTISVASGTQMGTSKPVVRVTTHGWTDTGSGGAGFVVERREADGSCTPLTGTFTGSSVNVALDPGKTYRLGLVAVDVAGNRSACAVGAPFTLVNAKESSSAITWSGTWRTAGATGYMDGRVRYATRAGAWATFRFTGRSVSWVTTASLTRGAAEVWVDGKYKATIRLGVTGKPRTVKYTATWATSGAHRIQIRVLGRPSAHPRVDVDGFIVLR